eukprot:COSAG02_NODE_8844_length_2422_cov_256.492467_2_plen_246_part_00
MGRGAGEDGTAYLVRSACILTIFTSIGFLMVVSGNYERKRFEGLDATVDFTKGTCTVEEVQHSERSGTAGTTHQCVGSDCPVSCDDFYIYMLDAAALGVETTQPSEPEVVSRSTDQACPSDTQQQASELELSVGTTVPCWVANRPGEIPRLNSGTDGTQPTAGYNCGSVRCVKIFDPVEEAADLRASGTGLIIGGLFTIVGGLLLLATGWYFRQYGRCCHPRLVHSNNEGVHHGMSHPSRGSVHA